MNPARWAVPAAALALVAASGVANGLWSDRWGNSTELARLTANVPNIPMAIGPWKGRDAQDPELLEALKKRGSIHAMISRTYINQETGEQVDLIVATGRPGPIATHNPLTCIAGGDKYTLDGGTRSASVTPPGTEPARFSACLFTSNRPELPSMSMFWSWRTPRGWIEAGSRDPRVTFASFRALTKIYVAQVEPPGANPAEDPEDAVHHFLRDALPTIDAALDAEPARPSA
jgi:hypothetical protein